MIALIATVLALAVILSIVWYTVRLGISPMPSTRSARTPMVEMLEGVGAGPIYELGAGWGGLLCELATRYPNHQIIGIELSPLPYWFSKLRCWATGKHNVQLMRRNFLDIELSDASALVCYLYPGAMHDLGPQLQTLKPGTFVISNTFSVPGWEPETMVILKDLYRTPVYRYRA